MNIQGIKRSKDWPFAMPPDLAEDIDALVDAMACDSKFLDCYQLNLEGGARGVAHEYDMMLRAYYLEGGWHDDVIN